MILRTALLLTCLTGFPAIGSPVVAAELRVGTFDLDATPPRGSRLAYSEMIAYDQPLRCRGVVLVGAGDPIVLCAVDWIGISNESQDRWKAALAGAAGTTSERVAVHALHQHEAPPCDFTTENILRAHGHSNTLFNVKHAVEVISNAAVAVSVAVTNLRVVTHIGVGTGRVEKIASNRRILGTNGTVRATRWTACRDAKLRAEPAGVVDNDVAMVGLFHEDTPLAVLSWFACHPQSYYRNGVANPDFPGMARILHEARLNDVLHLHFTGAGGNIGAGKWNDGRRRNRLVLAQRLADGMGRAWDHLERHPVRAEGVRWRTRDLALPLAEHLVESNLVARLEALSGPEGMRPVAGHLAWLRRQQAGRPVTLACLDFGPAVALFMPGELFVEYQLAAKDMRPDAVVGLAAYGEYGCGYICTEAAYGEGGYEASQGASLVAPHTEGVLLQAMRELLREGP